MKFNIRKGDTVRIIAGDDKGKVGEVLFVFPKLCRVVVRGCGLVKKSVRPTEENKKGGFLLREASIHASNVKKVEEL